MTPTRKTLIFILMSLPLQVALAQSQGSYTRLHIDIMKSINASTHINLDADQDNRFDSSNSKDRLIRDNLDKKWLAPSPPSGIKNVAPDSPKQFLEGTGTRGGGSGFVVKRNDGLEEVVLLDVFRSQNLGRYNLFFPLDSELQRMESAAGVDAAAEVIFATVLARIEKEAPHLGRKIRHLYEVELPFKNWIPLYVDLPQIEDETSHPMENNNERIQIAMRRTQHILYNTRAYAAMNALNRAALWLHEYIYVLSGTEKSVKTQRAVSLFFSSEFLKVAQDEAKFVQLIFDLDLLSQSQSSLAVHLPPKTRVTEEKQTANCGPMQEMKLTANLGMEIFANFYGSPRVISLSRADTAIFMIALLMNKNHLQGAFPIYKYYGQKILVDLICMNSNFSKVTQIQSRIAIDSELASVTRDMVHAEIEFYKAQSNLALQTSKGDISTPESIKYINRQMELAKIRHLFEVKSITSFENTINPKILGESIIAIEF